MSLVGIMQGRLSPRPRHRLQAFPWNSWESEFALAKQCHLDAIEWLFEADSYQSNPIWSDGGIRNILRCVEETGVSVRTLCADYFMTHPFFRVSERERDQSINILQALIVRSARAGVQTILIPVLEDAEIRSQADTAQLQEALSQCLDAARAADVKLGLETELPAAEYLDLVRSFNSPLVGAYYDTGNAAACGYDMRTDVGVLGGVLFGVHVKDRRKGGPSVPLGSGDANFAGGIPYLCRQEYHSLFVLQNFFNEDPYGAARMSLKFIQSLMKRGTETG